MRTASVLDKTSETISSKTDSHPTNFGWAVIIDSINFANKYGVALEIIKGADHRFKKPGELEQVVYHAINFIKK